MAMNWENIIGYYNTEGIQCEVTDRHAEIETEKVHMSFHLAHEFFATCDISVTCWNLVSIDIRIDIRLDILNPRIVPTNNKLEWNINWPNPEGHKIELHKCKSCVMKFINDFVKMFDPNDIMSFCVIK